MFKEISKYFDDIDPDFRYYRDVIIEPSGNIKYRYYLKDELYVTLEYEYYDEQSDIFISDINELNVRLSKSFGLPQKIGYCSILFYSDGIHLTGIKSDAKLSVIIKHDLDFLKELYNYNNGIYKKKISNFVMDHKNRFLRDYDCLEFRELLVLMAFNNV